MLSTLFWSSAGAAHHRGERHPNGPAYHGAGRLFDDPWYQVGPGSLDSSEKGRRLACWLSRLRESRVTGR